MLETLARKGASPFGRLHALWTLDGLGLLDDELVVRALGDTEAGVRENALRLAEPRLAGSRVLQAAVLARAVVEPDARARFQLLATLGGLDSAESRAAQQQLFFAHLDDPWMQVAALSAGPDRAAAYLERRWRPTASRASRQSDGHAAFFTLAGSAVAATREPGRVAGLIAAVARGGASDAWWQAAALEGVRRGMRGAGASLLDGSRADLLALAQGPDTGVRRASLGLLGIAKLGDGPDGVGGGDQGACPGQPTRRPTRPDAPTRSAWRRLAASRRARRSFRRGSIRASPSRCRWPRLRRSRRCPARPSAGSSLRVWPTLTPGARSGAIDLLLADPARERLLVEALRTGAVQSWTMNFWQKRELIMHRDPELRAAARALLEDRPEARAAIVNRYAAAVERGGDAERGGAVFAKACAACHKVGNGTPSDLGPDLSGIRHRPPLALLVDVLSPNQAIAQGYETYLIERTNGRSDAGTLAEQTPTTVTLRQAGQPILIAAQRHQDDRRCCRSRRCPPISTRSSRLPRWRTCSRS